MTGHPTISPNRFYGFAPVDGIAPVDGWAMMWDWEDDGDGFSSPCYIARSAECDEMLHVSRFRFAPTQERFAWLVRHGFPKPARGNWDNTQIEAMLENERLAA